MAAPAPDLADIPIEPETPFDRAAVEQMVTAAFGPGRFAKVSERVRELSSPIEGGGFVARDGADVIGSVRLWGVSVAGRRVAFLGPLAVDAGKRSDGLGGRLVEIACAAAERLGYEAVLLVGPQDYFARFGFVRAPVRFPWPVDRARVLARVFVGAELDGPLEPQGR